MTPDEIPSDEEPVAPAPRPAPPPRPAWRDDPALHVIMILAGLLVFIAIDGLATGQPSPTVFAILSVGPVLGWPNINLRRNGLLGCWLAAYLAAAVLAIVVLHAVDWTGPAFALATVGLMAALLPRQETGPAARDWGLALVLALWGVISTLGLLGLLTIRVPIGWAVVPVLGGLIGYHAGRRAGIMQGQSERVATGIGIVIALSGGILLGPSGGPGVMLVIGLVGGLLAANLAPPPPPVARRDVRAMLQVYQQLVFVAPLTYALLWLAQTFFT